MKMCEQPNVRPDGLYNVRQTATALGYKSPETVRRMLRQGVFRTNEKRPARYGRQEMRLTGSAILRVWNGR